MKTKSLILSMLFCIGIVDSIEDNVASVEFKTDDGGTYHTDIPVDFFPCNVEEGSQFYAQIVDGVTELRCGEPPI